MVRHGEMQCSSCHADPSGGELLTKDGRVQGNSILRMTYGKKADVAPTAGNAAPGAPAAPPARNGFLWGAWDTPNWLLLGGALRAAGFTQSELRVFPMQMDLYGQIKFGRFRAGGSLGVARLKPPFGPSGPRRAMTDFAEDAS
jgi:hypothetical protein